MPDTSGTVVVVDDDDATRALIARWLEKAGLTVVTASSGADALAKLDGLDFVHCMVLDVMMPGMTGVEVLQTLDAEGRLGQLHVMMLTAHATDDQDLVRAMELGASDYMVKPFSGPVLVARVKAIVTRAERARIASERLRAAEQHATIDPLTGLYNRRNFERVLHEAASRARRHKAPCAVVMLDIDHFKSINDTLGHTEGDRVLVLIAEVIRQSLRGEDHAFRYGGEEFALLLPGADRHNATIAIERMRTALARRPHLAKSGVTRAITFSAGVAAVDTSTDFTESGVVDAADRALYRAKHAGRNRTEVDAASDEVLPRVSSA
jgi:diguanylate cyclase (GGDEF)-like protein